LELPLEKEMDVKPKTPGKRVAVAKASKSNSAVAKKKKT
jgi:hypothetical protein